MTLMKLVILLQVLQAIALLSQEEQGSLRARIPTATFGIFRHHILKGSSKYKQSSI